MNEGKTPLDERTDDLYSEYDSDIAFLKDHAIRFDTDHFVLGIRPYVALTRRFGTLDNLVEFIEDGGDITEIHGVGRQTELDIHRWYYEQRGVWPEELPESNGGDSA